MTIPYDPSSALISLHIPKTAGTSLGAVLSGWFGDRLRYHYRQPGGQLPLRHELTSSICVHGHFNAVRGFGVDAYYPRAQQFITFIREPFERYLSRWFFINAHKQAGFPTPMLDRDPTFAAFLHARAEEESVGRNPISMLAQLPGLADCIDFGQMMDRRFVFVGVTERYQDSVEALAATLGMPPAHVDYLNRAERPIHDFDSFRPFYERHFATEFELYEAALSCNAELVRQYRS